MSRRLRFEDRPRAAETVNVRKKKRRSLASLVGCVSVCLFGLDIRVELLRVHSKELGLFSSISCAKKYRG